MEEPPHFGIIDIVDDIELDFCLLEHAGCLVGLQHCLVRLSVSGRRSHPWPRGTLSACSGKVFLQSLAGDLVGCFAKELSFIG